MVIDPLPQLNWISVHDWLEEDTVIVIKQDAAWQALQPRDLDWDIGIELDAPMTATEAAFERLVDQCDDMGDIIYAIGSGVAVDAAKFVAKELELPLVAVPTAISDDAFLTWRSGVRREGVVRYVDAIPPEIVLLDVDVIGRSPQAVRAAGIVDVLSIATACRDWALAEERGKNPSTERYQPQLASIAQAILDLGLSCAEAAGQGDANGLQALVSALAMEVQLCNLVGHTRAGEGSEHFFAYCADALAGGVSWQGGAGPSIYTHAELVGPGIVLMAERQGRDVAAIRTALEAAGVPLNTLPHELVAATLRELPAYVRQHNLPYGIAWEL